MCRPRVNFPGPAVQGCHGCGPPGDLRCPPATTIWRRVRDRGRARRGRLDRRVPIRYHRATEWGGRRPIMDPRPGRITALTRRRLLGLAAAGLGGAATVLAAAPRPGADHADAGPSCPGCGARRRSGGSAPGGRPRRPGGCGRRPQPDRADDRRRRRQRGDRRASCSTTARPFIARTGSATRRCTMPRPTRPG